MAAETIKITGARQHNLKNLSLQIPRQKLVVITGLSGSGKSSLAFDTLYAEGQRRYVESLSAYARQFLDQMQKPDVDFIEGLSPAIAIEQRSSASNPRSTIATTTEIYDYLRALFSAIGQPHDPATGQPVFKQSAQTIVDALLAFPQETKLILLAPLVQAQSGEFRDVLEKIKREGFVRARIDGEIVELGQTQTPIRLEKAKPHTIEAVVDRVVVRDGVRQRFADSVDTALKWGGGRMAVLAAVKNGGASGEETWTECRYSTDFTNPETGFTVPQLTPKHFSFNSHLGACPACHGLGTELVCDPDLMVSDPQKSLAQGAITPWARAAKRMQKYYAGLLDSLVRANKVSTDTPFADLPERFKEVLFNGTGERAIEITWGDSSRRTKVTKPFEGLSAQLQRMYEESDSEFTRNRIRACLMPALEATFANFRDTFARSAQHAAQAQTLLMELAEQDLAAIGTPPVMAELQRLSRARQANVLRHWLKVTHQTAPSAAQLAQLLDQIDACRTRGHRIQIKVGSGFVERRGPSLHWYNPPVLQ